MVSVQRSQRPCSTAILAIMIDPLSLAAESARHRRRPTDSPDRERKDVIGRLAQHAQALAFGELDRLVEFEDQDIGWE
jgi:hypothetical protein